MSIAALITDLVMAGTDPELVGRVAEALAMREPVVIKDEQAERRRAADRERKRVSIPQNSAESADEAKPPLPLDKEIPPTPPKEIKPYPRENTASAKGTRITGCWSPQKRDWDFAIAEIGSTAADRELSKFRDYWISKPGQGGVKLDWSATWRNWIRSAKDRLPRAGPQAGKPKGGDGWAEIFREANGIGEFADGFGSNSKTGDTPGPVIEGTVHGAWDRP